MAWWNLVYNVFVEKCGVVAGSADIWSISAEQA